MSNISRARFQKLAGILTEESKESLQETIMESASRPFDMDAKEMLVRYCAWLRAIHIWFHGAHHTTRGVGFSGDHTDLFERIYTAVQDEVDGAIEKAIGITGDQSMGCPKVITREAMTLIERYGSPAEMESKNIAKEGLKIEEDYIAFVERMFRAFEAKDVMTLGLNDQLAASANAHETFVYLLSQRVRSTEDTIMHTDEVGPTSTFHLPELPANTSTVPMAPIKLPNAGGNPFGM